MRTHVCLNRCRPRPLRVTYQQLPSESERDRARNDTPGGDTRVYRSDEVPCGVWHAVPTQMTTILAYATSRGGAGSTWGSGGDPMACPQLAGSFVVLPRPSETGSPCSRWEAQDEADRPDLRSRSCRRIPGFSCTPLDEKSKDAATKHSPSSSPVVDLLHDNEKTSLPYTTALRDERFLFGSAAPVALQQEHRMPVTYHRRERV